jgi:WD40 repeat protein
MGQQLGEPLKGHTVTVHSVSFSSDGTRIASGSKDNTVRVWDAVTGQQLGETFQGPGLVLSFAFSSDGTRIASGSSEGTVRLWDAVTGQPLSEFSPDGTRIASGSDDETAAVGCNDGRAFG